MTQERAGAPAPRTSPEGRRETVEVWTGSRCRGVIDRRTFRDWVRTPRDWLVSDDVLFVGGPGFVGLAVRDELVVGAISSAVVITLRGLV